ncbi:putative metallopeptidase [Xanthobacteraceae bacterium A53D]
MSTFIDEGAVLENEEHAHLRNADIGFLWTNVANARQGRSIIGQAELGEPQGAMGKWAKARARAQVRGWFGGVPDFIITIDATWSAEADDASFCALLEHELSHCGQERDGFGMPKFKRYGQPVWGLRAHDVETFVGVAKRYGAVEAGVRELVDAVLSGPTIAQAAIDHACGTCHRKAA